MDSITGLNPDLTQLAAALESVKFEKDEVLGAIREAWTDGNAPVGWTPEWGDSKFRVYPVLSSTPSPSMPPPARNSCLRQSRMHFR